MLVASSLRQIVAMTSPSESPPKNPSNESMFWKTKYTFIFQTRGCVLTNDVSWLLAHGQHWTGLNSLVMVESTREILQDNGGFACSRERR